ASSSPYRRDILNKIGIPFHSISPQINEKAKINESCHDLVQRLALQKAQAVAKEQTNHLIIGSDQVAFLEGEILSKPHTQVRAIEQLSRCSGKVVSFHTGLCLYDSSDDSYQLEEDIFKVHFRDLTLREITHYIALEKPLDCAGSFKVEGLGISLFKKLEGDDFNSLIGLPLIRLLAMLKTKGISPLQAN
ncbi:MAG: septum formation inhibitor Maf, partial [Oceanospirillaceae bacterium]|nr:septum formation inhibitor Maf [Oceanospirillaceae bacterium]